MWKGAVVLISVLTITLAYQAIAQLESKPDKFKDQPGCYISKLERVIPFGKDDSRAPANDSEECLQYSCGEHHVVISGCSPVVAEPPCTTFLQRDKPYPDCCPQIKCP